MSEQALPLEVGSTEVSECATHRSARAERRAAAPDGRGLTKGPQDLAVDGHLVVADAHAVDGAGHVVDADADRVVADAHVIDAAGHVVDADADVVVADAHAVDADAHVGASSRAGTASANGRDGALAEVAALLRAHGGLVSRVVADPPAAHRAPAPGFGDVGSCAHAPGATAGAIVARGPRAAGRERDYERLVEAIYEGYLLHYGSARIVLTDDTDLRLLAGDQLYALGLAQLVALGDIAAVSELADVISLTALAQAGGDAGLADAVWSAGLRAVGWGADEAHEAAKALAREGAPGAADALSSWATR